MRRLHPILLFGLLALLVVPPDAGAQFIPYYGKNKIKYDNFAWRVYKSPHFEVFYYPEFEQHLARLVSYLESGYLKISTGLKHEMSRPIPVIFYKTHSEFEQTNLFPAFVPEAVAAFTENLKNRMVIPIDEPPDRLQGLITHEMTHAFAFDLIPRGLGYEIQQKQIPLWIDEGLADYFRGVWDPLDLMMVRDAALTDNVPKLSKAEFEAFSGRLVYNMGHAAFEFMEARYGKEGIRQLLYGLRKGQRGKDADEELFQQAFRTTPQEFDAAFEKWLKERFKPFRDRQNPDDFGRDLSPDPEKTEFTQAFAFAPSPSGEIAAIITVNRKEGEADVLLVSTKSGEVIKNLTAGFENAWESFSVNSEFTAGRSLAFDPSGDYVGFFARSGKRRAFVLLSVLDGSLRKKVRVALDEPQAPCILPDGRGVLFAALKDGVSDIWKLDLKTGKVTNLTNDEYADNNPQVSPDGKMVVYDRRISGYPKLFAFPLEDPSRKTQLTFGAFTDQAPYFSSDGAKVYYASGEDDDIPNLRSIDLRTGVIAQYTDVFGGAMAPTPLKADGGDRLAFITYHKGEFKLHTRETSEPLKEVEQDVRAAAEGMVDFQPDVAHEVVPENKRRKHLFEGLYLEERPPINLGITSSGDFFGGSAVALSDTLGDQLFALTATSVASYRTFQVDYINLSRRLHYGVSAFDQKYFYYPDVGGYATYYDYYDIRDYAVATQRLRGAALFAQYPLDVFRRLELAAGLIQVEEQYDGSYYGMSTDLVLNNGWQAPISLRLVQETTRFAEFGPLSGSTFSLGFTYAPGIGSFLERRTFDVDLRKYLRLSSTSALVAFRARGFYSSGENPDYNYFGGNMEMRGYPYMSFVGNQGFFANAEFRVPIVERALTPLGVLGPLRGTVFFGIGGAKYQGQDYSFSTSADGYSYVRDPVYGEAVSGWRLLDGRASWGLGLQLFLFGYPLHFDWVKYTDFAKTSEGWDFSFWLGYDF